MSAELEDVKALLLAQDATNAKRFDEQGERLDKAVSAIKAATDVLQDHGKRIEAIERTNEEREQRMTRAEASAAVLGERLGQLGERLQTTQSAVEAQGKAAAANAQEMQTQTQTLKEIREGQVKRDALLDQHLGLLGELRDDKIRREERAKIAGEQIAKTDRKRNYLIAVAGLALAVLSALSGWLVYREQAHSAQQSAPSAIVAPAIPH